MQAQAAYDTADWSSLIQCLQTLTLAENFEASQRAKKQEYLLELALAVLQFGDFEQRWEIAKVLTRMEKIALPSLINILVDEDAEEELRWYAARILGDFKNPDTIVPLVELLKNDDNEELREIAATALGQMGAVAINALTELLTEKQTRLLAVQVLSYIRQKEIITPLLGVVQDSQVAVRAIAIEALSSFHDPRISPVLLNALDDVVAIVRREAVLGLGFRSDLRSELDLVEKLQRRLYDFNIDVCCAAAVSLSRMGCDSAAQHLFQVLISPHTPTQLQLEAIRALSWVGTISGLEYLKQALHQLQSPTLCLEIVTVLGRVSGETLTDKAVDILLETLKQNHSAIELSSVKSAVALSLGLLGKIQAKDALVQLLTDEDAQVRLHTIAALKKLAP